MTVYERTGSIVGSTEYYVIEPTGNQIRDTCDWPAAPTRQQVKALVDSSLNGEAEHIVVMHKGESRSMFVNRYANQLALPFNGVATEIYRAYTLKRYPGVKPSALATIRGPALLFGRVVWEGEL